MYFDTKNNLKGNYKYIFFWKNRERKKKEKNSVGVTFLFYHHGD
jgi:hypothetical protein